MDQPVDQTMQSELSFLTPTQTEVFTTLWRLFPNVSKDVLVVTLTSPEIYYDGIDKLVLLNRCMDEMEVQSKVIDLTRGLGAPSTDPANVASTSKPLNNNNDIITGPSPEGNSLMPSISIDTMQGTSGSAFKDGKEQIPAEPVIVVNDSLEDVTEDGLVEDVIDVKLRNETEPVVADKAGPSDSTPIEEKYPLDYLSDSSGSPPEIILLPDDNENTISTLEMKKLDEAGPSGKPNAFQTKDLLDSESPEKESSIPWRKIVGDSQKGHVFLEHEEVVPPSPPKVTRDISTNFKNSLDSSSRTGDVSTTVPQIQGFVSDPLSGVKLTPVGSCKQKYPELVEQPMTSSNSSVSSAENVKKDRGCIPLEHSNKRVHSTPKQPSGSSSVGSSGSASPRSRNLPSGSNLATSSPCRIHRGIKQCDCNSHISSTKSTKEDTSKFGVQNVFVEHKGLYSGKSHLHNIPLKGTTETATNSKASTPNSQTPQLSEKDSGASTLSTGVIAKRVEPVAEKLQVLNPQPNTPQPIKQSGDSLPKRVQIVRDIHPGSLPQTLGPTRETSQNPKVVTSTPSTTQQTSALSPAVTHVHGQFHVVKTVGGNNLVVKRVGNTWQPCSKMTVKEAIALARSVQSVNNSAGIPNISNSNVATTQAGSQTGVKKLQQVKQIVGPPLAGINPTRTPDVARTPASMNHSKVTSQISQNKKTDTPGRAQTGHVSQPAFHARVIQSGMVLNPAARPQPSIGQISQPKEATTFGKSQTGTHSSTAFQARPTQVGMVSNPTIRPPIGKISQTKETNTPGNPGKSQTWTHSSTARPVQVVGMLAGPARAQPLGVQPPTRLSAGNLAQLSKALQQLKNNVNTLATQNRPGTSQATGTASGNTQTVRVAEQLLGNAAFLPRNVALNQGQRQNNARPENGVPFPQQRAPTPVVQNRNMGAGAVRPSVCQVHGGLNCNCPVPPQVGDIFQVTEQVAVDVSPFMAKVFSLFPDADPDFVKQKLQTVVQSVPDPVQWVCNLMLEDSYPRKQVPVRPKTPPPSTSKPKEFDYINKWRELPRIPYSSNYIAEARQVLAFSFKLISMASIDEVMRATNYRFTPAFVVLEKIVASKQYITAEKSNQRPMTHHHSSQSNLSICCELPGERSGLLNGKKFEEKRFRIKLNRKPRTSMIPCTNKELKKEMEYYNNFIKEKQEEQDHQLALHMNEEEYEQNQQGIECECCFAEYPFENMVQCFEMHLFCSDCLQRYVKEAIFGQGKGNLACMATDCSSTFPRDQIEKSLPPDLLAKYDERCREESVHLADLEDLVRCPHCNFAATLALEIKAFLCPQCGKETCRDCQQDWKEHFGKKCKELESKSEEQLRTKYEEKLTEALIRTCHRCKASIVKENGCNKMTCRCGAKMCYICRKPNIDYNHFCQHVRDPSRKGCNKCNACCLWEIAEVVDEKKMNEIKNEMKDEQEQKGIDDKKRAVGVPENIGGGPSKRPRMQ